MATIHGVTPKKPKPPHHAKRSRSPLSVTNTWNWAQPLIFLSCSADDLGFQLWPDIASNALYNLNFFFYRGVDFQSSYKHNSSTKPLVLVNVAGDVSRKKDIEKALHGADCVFHLASYGMSGKEMLQARHVDEVIINGTCNVLDVCHEFGIKRLVYISTYNVVFGGKEIVNRNEALPYFLFDDHIDPYVRSKSVAEQLVLKSNGRPSKKKNGVRLYTCAIRPAGIYGPGEERHLPRILSLAKMGLLLFKVGSPSVKTDWVYVENLVLALISPSMGLLDDILGREGQPVTAGQPYFISDDWCDPLLFNSENKAGAWLCTYGEPSRWFSCNYSILAGKKKERIRWANYVCVAFCCNRDVSIVFRCFPAPSWTSRLGESLQSFYISINVDHQTRLSWISSFARW
uniref:Short-chain dehydrogenase/reductase family 42E member 1 n=1 Tax=Elaeis guineensis var. tenera TaxID=51953 RepID=A0A6J0PL99_ELAGV|nr:short-chain dehydrogenase/reductase family 42E member 1 [Elaeis guineensis]